MGGETPSVRVNGLGLPGAAGEVQLFFALTHPFSSPKGWGIELSHWLSSAPPLPPPLHPSKSDSVCSQFQSLSFPGFPVSGPTPILREGLGGPWNCEGEGGVETKQQ